MSLHIEENQFLNAEEQGISYIRNLHIRRKSDSVVSLFRKEVEYALYRPIKLIASIANEEIPESQWDLQVNSISCQALKQLAEIIIQRKRSGENSTNLKQITEELVHLRQILKEEISKNDLGLTNLQSIIFESASKLGFDDINSIISRNTPESDYTDTIIQVVHALEAHTQETPFLNEILDFISDFNFNSSSRLILLLAS